MSRTNIYNKILCRVLDKSNNRQTNVHLRTAKSCERFQHSFRRQSQCKHFKSIGDFTKFLLPINCENVAALVTTTSPKVRPKRSLIPVPISKSRTKNAPTRATSIPNYKAKCDLQLLTTALSNKIMDNLLFPRPPFVRCHSHIATKSMLLAEQID